MATRSIKLKLKISGKENLQLRQDIWRTHHLVNEGVAYYLKLLVSLRQKEVKWDHDSEPVLPEDPLPLAREAQRRNGKDSLPGSDEEIRDLLRKLYEELVPSSTGKSGKANMISSNYLRPITDPHSEGGQGVSTRGRKPGWHSMPEGPEKEEAIIKSEKEKREKLAASSLIALKSLGVLPLVESFSILKGFNPKKSGVTLFDCDMFCQVIERLMSWESWNARVDKEKNGKEVILRKIESHFDDEKIQKASVALRRYEQEREGELQEIGFASDNVFRITRRMIRGWERLRRVWQKIPPENRSRGNLQEAINKLAMRMEIGDAADFFPWLALPENHFLWAEETIDPVRIWVNYNTAALEFEKASSMAVLTLPNPLLHPLWIRFSHLGDTNLEKYDLRLENDQLSGSIFLISKARNTVKSTSRSFPISSSVQWDGKPGRADASIEIINFEDVPGESLPAKAKKSQAKCKWIRYTDPGSGEVFYGTLGGARLQLDRDDFRIRSSNPDLVGSRSRMFEDAGAEFPRVFLNVTLNLLEKTSTVNACWTLKEPPGSDYKMAMKIKGPQLDDALSKTGSIRVMSCDLGMRHLAACSVFEIRKGRGTGNQRQFPVAGCEDTWIRHEHSFIVTLPGERPDKKAKDFRDETRKKRLDLRSAARRLSNLLSLGCKSLPPDREKMLSALIAFEGGHAREINTILDPTVLAKLQLHINDGPEQWREEVLKAHRKWEKSLGEHIHEWRQRNSRDRFHENRKMRGWAGLSIWNIDELENTRKFLNGWSCHSRDYVELDGRPGEFRPQEVRARNRWGSQAKDPESGSWADIDERLLRHINNLKEDRVKVAADRIVMAALGFEFREHLNQWKKVREHSCDLILFEDLSRFRFRTDRPPRENSKLMQWSHRELPRLVAMQGELQGINVGLAGADFSSRFLAASDEIVPGIRCERFNQEQLDQGWVQRKLEESRDEGKIKRMPKPGDLVPWDLGQFFVTLKEDGKPHVTHADINAAQNIARRFFTDYNDIYRLRARPAGDDGFEIDQSGARIQRALERIPGIGKASCILVPSESKSYALQAGGKNRKKPKGSATSKPEVSDDVGAQGLLAEIEEATGKVCTFFRDPSGRVIPLLNGEASWYPAGEFWCRVNRRIVAAIEAYNETPRPRDGSSPPPGSDEFPY